MSAVAHIVDIGKDFSRYPAGRFQADGPYSGEVFRKKYLVPALDRGEHIVIALDSTAGYGSSFLEEAFGGLIRLGYNAERVLGSFEFRTKDPSLQNEILEYIRDAAKR